MYRLKSITYTVKSVCFTTLDLVSVRIDEQYACVRIVALQLYKDMV